MNWFKKHLNLTLFFAWIIYNIIVYSFYFSDLSSSWMSSWIFMIATAVIFLSIEIWYLLQKHRSLFNLFYNLLNIIGLIIILSLHNNNNIDQENVNDTSM
jgi:hypothetical protein